jgi:hypothetical protein
VVLVSPKVIIPGLGYRNLTRRLSGMNTAIDFVVGHGRITGPMALAQKTDFYPTASYVHFIHMAPEAIEVHKEQKEGEDSSQKARERVQLEAGLGFQALLVVAVGPELFARFSETFHERALVHQFLPGLFEVTATTLAGGARCLIFGRAEDSVLKGIRFASGAFRLWARSREAGAERIQFIVRGAAAGTATALQRELSDHIDNVVVPVKPNSV